MRVLQTRSIVLTWSGLAPREDVGGQGDVVGLTEAGWTELYFRPLTEEGVGLSVLQAVVRTRAEFAPASHKISW